MNAYFVMLWGLLKGGLLAFTILIILDFVFGIIVSLVKKLFKWEYLMHYVYTDVLPVFGWVGVVVLTTIPTENLPEGALPIASGAVYVTVFLSILASLLGSFSELGILTKPLNKIGIGNNGSGTPPVQ